MADLYIYFKPTAAEAYNISWKKSTDLTYPPLQTVTVNKLPGLWNHIRVDIDDNLVDWNFRIIPICQDSPGTPYYGIVRAICNPVEFEAQFDYCYQCPGINHLTMVAT